MGDTPPMTKEQEEGVVALGSNPKGVLTTQLINKPKTKKTKAKEFNNRMLPKALRQLIEKPNDKQKEAIKEIGFGNFLYLQVDMILGKALLQDAKKARNEIISNTHVLVRVMTELEKLVPEAHSSLKRVRMIAVQTTTDALFAEITSSGKSKSTTSALSPDSCESEEENHPTATLMFICEAEPQEESVAPATGLVIREMTMFQCDMYKKQVILAKAKLL
ncbi:hypothetical protein Cgig2_027404 [Carnegiea gigantea]|uniref:Uncharacterized protein n=1 Tax=Carnegiea gigantea TaxID=171969 RepID=A0A9Q1JKM8_9CARY|nr:hypothetical protein Cgig2_027404 [Carnegiea gigantea]